MKRGEVWWAFVDKRRPVVLVSRDEAYEVRSSVVVAPVTTTIRGFSVEVKLGRREGLPRDGVIHGDWLVTVPLADLESKIGTLSKTKLTQLEETLRFALGL
ncbi:MAG: type II toxin-antitoxin system PemK/MazF family toxin [Clostridia bacterium]|nr:type II toxin-antitoxin system PemK/MazF family toxin [Deltaproteobacteria bacterium]